jgi:NADH:ubiquinone oxidoreductase subunit 5 (subunit L)/multisubunit Na+/H+ antiporter MnhA subunit
MEGPSSASAMIHAALVVLQGQILFYKVVDLSATSYSVGFVCGAGLVTYSICSLCSAQCAKRVIAYSTASNIAMIASISLVASC